MTGGDVLVSTPAGLYCPAGGFYIDPVEPVDLAVLTHAHADHARRGSRAYIAAADGVALLRKRLGGDASLDAQNYSATRTVGSTRLSFHPAGHVLGSAQVRVETDDTVWLVSGDYKRQADLTCAAFETVACDVFVTEATFAQPQFRWPATDRVIDQILHWWRDNARDGRASVLFCYALGKAQRVLAELASRDIDRPVLCHGAVDAISGLYRKAGIVQAPTERLENASPRSRLVDYAGRLVLAPPGAARTPWMSRFGQAGTGFCSGWMQVEGECRRRGFDRGFVLSDHADWDALIETVAGTGARRVLTHHGYADALARHLERQSGMRADVLADSSAMKS